jgi:geranylgeranyl reductase family protein
MMDSMFEVAIVGGGPAGSHCAYCLAENGIYPVIFDHSHPREKPCGGMISPLAQEIFPFLKELPIEHAKRKKMVLMTPSGKKISLDMRKGAAICVSRLAFDQFLLNMAVSNGAKLLKEKVMDVKKQGNFWKIKTDKNLYVAKKLVGADGVNSVVRSKVTAPLKNTDKGICYGYFTERLEDENLSFHFLPHREGYIWVIPRKNNVSIGIGCAEVSRSSGLKKELDMFIKKRYPYIKILSSWAALIPNIKNTETLCIPVAGKTWVLIGDAASHVNAITGEGIPYALLSGELAAQAITKNNIPLYEELWRRSYGLNLLLGVKFRNLIYKKPMLEFYCRYLKMINNIWS